MIHIRAKCNNAIDNCDGRVPYKKIKQFHKIGHIYATWQKIFLSNDPLSIKSL